MLSIPSDGNSLFSDLKRSCTPASLGTCSHYPLATPSLWSIVCLKVQPLVLVQPHGFKSHLSICPQDQIRIFNPTFIWSIRTFYPTMHSHLYLFIKKCTRVALVFDSLACFHTPFLCDGTPLSSEEAMPSGWKPSIPPVKVQAQLIRTLLLSQSAHCTESALFYNRYKHTYRLL